ncbi:MAG TPA: hypothetical protein ENK18_00525 [Deltaproteobacteria bacterium]|nr:hypothetical protein [Deltaproteobacteria bacterium]
MPALAGLAPPPRTGPVPLPPLLGAGKGVRDAFGLPNTRGSQNFAVHWGNSGSFSNNQVQNLLDSFEHAWSVYVGEMDHATPYGTESVRFNVYISDSGDGAPSSLGAGGYYWFDDEGWPMIVISRDVLFDNQYAAQVSHHEFYHAIQGATERFAYSGISAWFTEATAEWGAYAVDYNNPYNGEFLFAYGLLNEYPLPFFDYPDTGALQEYYQYGAFLFPVFVSELGGWQLIRDTWMDTGAEPDPLEVLRARMADDGLDLDEVWLDHTAHNAVWDYTLGAGFKEQVNDYKDIFGIDPIMATFSGEGTGGTEEVTERAPGHYGYNVIRLRSPDPGDLTITIDGNRGDEGSRVGFGARLIQDFGEDTYTYHDVPFDGRRASFVLEGVGEEDRIWLVVGAWAKEYNSLWAEERFTYSYSMEIVEAEPEPTETVFSTEDGTSEQPSSSCGCRSGSPVAAMLWAPLLLLLRRRRPARW